jgi:FkbM family methyltransferase
VQHFHVNVCALSEAKGMLKKMIDYFKDYERVKSYFEDKLSKQIFDYKINDLVRDIKDELVDYLYTINKTSRIVTFDEYYIRRGEKDIIIYGAGVCGERDYHVLKHAGYQVTAFIDDDMELQGQERCGIPVISIPELLDQNKEAIVIISNEHYKDIFYNQLISFGFPQENIFKVNTKLRTEFGTIYYDLPQLSEKIDNEGEVFIDAGAFDGESSLGFIKWCEENGAKTEKIYLFEPLHDGIKICERKLEGYNVEFFESGLGKTTTKLYFEKRGSNLMGSKVSKTGDVVIKIDSIDNILKGQKATFIKMDIEGSEADAIIGAAETIKKYKPKLAISMYHKRRDILELPELVKSLNPEYKLYLRHYSNMKWDFVMYAI